MPQAIVDWCRERNVTIEQLVVATGLEPGRVQAIVLGRWTPSPHERAAVAAALEITVDDVVWGHTVPIQRLYGHGPG